MGQLTLTQISPPGPSLPLPYFDQAGKPHITGGVGGWTEVALPQQLAGTRFDGTPLFKQDLTVYFDGYATSTPVEPQIRQLYRWGSPVAASAQPPILALTGNGFDRVTWVINDLDVPDDEYREDNQRTQAHVKISLLEFRDLTGTATAATSVRAQILGVSLITGLPYANPPSKKVLAEATDTWRSIAKRYLKDPNRWHDCEQLNPGLGVVSSTRQFGHPHHVLVPTR